MFACFIKIVRQAHFERVSLTELYEEIKAVIHFKVSTGGLTQFSFDVYDIASVSCVTRLPTSEINDLMFMTYYKNNKSAPSFTCINTCRSFEARKRGSELTHTSICLFFPKIRELDDNSCVWVSDFSLILVDFPACQFLDSCIFINILDS